MIDRLVFANRAAKFVLFAVLSLALLSWLIISVVCFIIISESFYMDANEMRSEVLAHQDIIDAAIYKAIELGEGGNAKRENCNLPPWCFIKTMAPSSLTVVAALAGSVRQHQSPVSTTPLRICLLWYLWTSLRRYIQLEQTAHFSMRNA